MRQQLFLLSLVVTCVLSVDSVEAFAKKKKKKTSSSPPPISICTESLALYSGNVESKAKQAHFIGQSLAVADMMKHLSALTGVADLFREIRVPDRFSQKNKALVREYISDHLRINRLKVEKEVFHHFGGDGVNLVAEIKGTKRPDTVYEINVHYDTTGYDKPGADDNGSGVALGLELVSLFSKFKPEATIRFIFADLEEQGNRGTDYHVNQLIGKPGMIAGAFVIDMIGWAPKKKEALPFVVEVGASWHHRSAGQQLTRELAQNYLYQTMMFKRENVSAEPKLNGAMPYTADHGPYWEAGIPALLIAAPYEGDSVNPNYHGKDDVIETMNVNYFKDVSRITAEAIAFSVGAKIPKSLGRRYKTALASYNDEIVEGVEYSSAIVPEERARPKRAPKQKSLFVEDTTEDDDLLFGLESESSWQSSKDTKREGESLVDIMISHAPSRLYVIASTNRAKAFYRSENGGENQLSFTGVSRSELIEKAKAAGATVVELDEEPKLFEWRTYQDLAFEALKENAEIQTEPTLTTGLDSDLAQVDAPTILIESAEMTYSPNDGDEQVIKEQVVHEASLLAAPVLIQKHRTIPPREERDALGQLYTKTGKSAHVILNKDKDRAFVLMEFRDEVSVLEVDDVEIVSEVMGLVKKHHLGVMKLRRDLTADEWQKTFDHFAQNLQESASKRSKIDEALIEAEGKDIIILELNDGAIVVPRESDPIYLSEKEYESYVKEFEDSEVMEIWEYRLPLRDGRTRKLIQKAINVDSLFVRPPWTPLFG